MPLKYNLHQSRGESYLHLDSCGSQYQAHYKTIKYFFNLGSKETAFNQYTKYYDLIIHKYYCLKK